MCELPGQGTHALGVLAASTSRQQNRELFTLPEVRLQIDRGIDRATVAQGATRTLYQALRIERVVAVTATGNREFQCLLLGLR